MSRLGRFVSPACLALALGCAQGGGVERIENGRRDVGRVVPPEAYAAYAAGIEHEAAGHSAAARDAYDEARRRDPESGAAWAALGRVTCADAPDDALRTFDDGLERAAERLPLFVARANCLAEHREFEQALLDARSALELAPDEPRITELYATILERLGRVDEARSARRALQFYQRSSPAREGSDPPEKADVAAVDRALSRGDFAHAERLAAGLLGSGELALRALALGQTEEARALASLVASAEPESADAAVVLLISSDAPAGDATSGDDVAARFGPLSPLGACLLAEYVTAHASAATWSPERSSEPASAAPDPLLATCRARLRKAPDGAR